MYVILKRYKDLTHEVSGYLTDLVLKNQKESQKGRPVTDRVYGVYASYNKNKPRVVFIAMESTGSEDYHISNGFTKVIDTEKINDFVDTHPKLQYKTHLEDYIYKLMQQGDYKNREQDRIAEMTMKQKAQQVTKLDMDYKVRMKGDTSFEVLKYVRRDATTMGGTGGSYKKFATARLDNTEFELRGDDVWLTDEERQSVFNILTDNFTQTITVQQLSNVLGNYGIEVIPTKYNGNPAVCIRNAKGVFAWVDFHKRLSFDIKFWEKKREMEGLFGITEDQVEQITSSIIALANTDIDKRGI